MENHSITQINTVSFTSDKFMFAFGTESGFYIYNIKPFEQVTNQKLDFGILLIEIIDHSNLLIFVGDGKNINYPNNKVILWDDSQRKSIGEIKLNHPILNIKVNSDYLFVITIDHVFVFYTKTLTNKEKFETYNNNENGVFTLCKNRRKTIFAFPNKELGYVNVIQFENEIEERKELKILTHVSQIACLTLSENGNFLSTASDNGTLIRIFKLDSEEMTHEFRRGTEKAKIYSLDFSPTNDFFCCTSDRGTLHIFNLIKDWKEDTSGRKKDDGIFSGLKRLIRIPKKVLITPRSFACFKSGDFKSFCVFGPNEEIFVVSADGNGKFYEVKFDKINGGETQDVQIFNLREDDNDNDNKNNLDFNSNESI